MRAPTIYENLSARLGRPATNAEAGAEVKRLLREFADEQLQDQAARGALPWQRRR